MTAVSIALPGHPDGPNNAERHRELILENFTPGRKRLSLMLTDDHHGHYKIPLGYDDTTAFNEDMSNPALKLVPVTFLRNIPEEGLGPLREGWVYIYVNGYLWREARYDTDCHMLIDVNLSYEKGLDRRRATVQKDSTLVLPWNMNGSESIVEIAFSEEQWSWERIDQLGGVDPEDPRQWLGERVESAYSTDYTAKARAARLMPIDLSAAESNFEDMPEDSNIRLVTNEELAPRRRHYNTKFDKGIASVILPDVIGDARYFAKCQADGMALLDAAVNSLLNADQPYPDGWNVDRIATAHTERIQTVADSRLAMLLNSQFFAPIDQQLKKNDLAEAQREVLEQRRDDRELLDPEALEAQLEKTACDNMIRQALDDRRDLIDLMDTPAFLAAIYDYHCLEHAHWFLLPELMGQLIGRFNQPVAMAYKDLFLNLDDYELYLDRDQGADFLLRLTGAHPSEKPHPLADILFPRSGPEVDNPLSIDDAEPSIEEQLLNPAKVRRIIDGLNGTDYLNWPPLSVNGTNVDMQDFAAHTIKNFTLSLTLMPAIGSSDDVGDADAITQAWRFAGHTAHAFGAVLSGRNYEDVKAAQSDEVTWSSKQDDLQNEQARHQASLNIAKSRQQELQDEERNYNEKINEKEQRIVENENLRHNLTQEKERLLGGRSEAEVLNESSGLSARINYIDRQLISINQQLTTERTQLAETKVERLQATEALSNINDRVQVMENSAGKVFSNFTLKHNTRIVNLYALLAGEHLKTLKVTHDDLLNNRLPQGYTPFTATGRLERLKGRLNTAHHIAGYQGPWVNFKLAPNHSIRVPADLAFENVSDLQQYMADFTHDAIMTVEEVTTDRINLLVISQEKLSETRAQATATIINNEHALSEARAAFKEKIEAANDNITRLENGKFRYKNLLSETKEEAEELVRMVVGNERKIAQLQAQIDDYEVMLDNSRPKLSFSNRMDKLFLFSGGMVVFEAWNLSQITDKLLSNPQNTRSKIDFFSAMVDFAATITGSAQYILESKYGNRAVIKSRLQNLTREQFIRTYPLTRSSATWILRTYNISIGLNILSGVVGSVISLLDAYNRWVLGDRDAAAAYGVVAVGFALTAAAVIPSLASASAMLGIVGFGLIAVGFTLVYFLTDTPLETLLKNSPFGKDVESRFSSGGFWQEESYQHWESRRDLAYHDIVSFLYQPQVIFHKHWVSHEEYCELIVQTPALMAEGCYKIDIQAGRIEDNEWETLSLVTNNPTSPVTTNPGSVQVETNGVRHHIRIHRDLIRSFGTHRGTSYMPFFGAINTVETDLRLRVKTYPKGEGVPIFPGSLTPYSLPAPKRDSEGRPVIDGVVVNEQSAMENSWLIAQGPITHGGY